MGPLPGRDLYQIKTPAKLPWGVSALFLLLLALSCTHTQTHSKAGFYYWKTSVQLSDPERRYLDSLNCQTLYVKFFDVDLDEQSGVPVPLALVSFPQKLPASLNAIPTVFITNRTLEQLHEKETDLLADRVLTRINSSLEEIPGHFPAEMQFDCDWTAGTRDRYFQLLAHLRRALATRHIRISATIRLHQIKYRSQTGVPPVDRGMLMCYNTGDLDDPQTPNSILDPKTVGDYLNNAGDYPLPLDVALPLFAWGVLIRDGQVIKLINSLRPETLSADPRFRQTGPNRFVVLKNTYLEGFYLYSDDEIRTESVTIAALEETSALLHKALPPAERTLAFFQLDPAVMRCYPVPALQKLLSK